MWALLHTSASTLKPNTQPSVPTLVTASLKSSPPQPHTATTPSPSSHQAVFWAGCFTTACSPAPRAQGSPPSTACSPRAPRPSQPPLWGTLQHLTLPVPQHNTAQGNSQPEEAFGTKSHHHQATLLACRTVSSTAQWDSTPCNKCLQMFSPAQIWGQQQASCSIGSSKEITCLSCCLAALLCSCITAQHPAGTRARATAG